MNLRFLGVVGLVLAFASCGVTPPPGYEKTPTPEPSNETVAPSPTLEPTSTPTVEPSPTDTPTASPFPSPGVGDDKVSFSWTNSSGYNFKIDLDPGDIEAKVDTAGQKPGEALIQTRGIISYTLTNQTPSRAADLGTIYGVPMYPVFSAADAPFCKDAISGPSKSLRQGKELNKASHKDLPYCFLSIEPQGPSPAGELGPNESADGKLTWSAKLTVPEKSVQESLSALAEPSFWVVGGNVKTDQMLKGMNACFVGDEKVVAATSEAGKTVCLPVATGEGATGSTQPEPVG